MRWALPCALLALAERARRMRDGKSNHEEISPSEKKRGEGIPSRFAQRRRGGRKGIPMRKGEPQSTTVARKRERVQNGAPSSGIINVTVGVPQTTAHIQASNP